MDVEAKPGQLLRRKKDGVLVRIESVSDVYRDCYWEAVEGKKRGAIYECNLPAFYDLEDEPEPTA